MRHQNEDFRRELFAFMQGKARMDMLTDSKSEAAFGATDIDEIRRLYAGTDRHQPAFGFEGHIAFDDRLARSYADRCKFIESRLDPDLKNITILHAGCGLGYVSLYLSSLGAQVVGIDRLQENIAFCQAIARELNLPASFRIESFSEQFCEELREGEFDVVFLSSSLHDIVRDCGVERGRAMMSGLLDKCDAVYVELESKSQTAASDRKDGEPDVLEILRGLANVRVAHVEDFPALNSAAPSALYLIAKTQKTYNKLVHTGMALRRSDIKDGRLRGRKYAISESFFSKIFTFWAEPVYVRFAREVYAAAQFANVRGFPAILGQEIRGNTGVVTYARIDGMTLIDFFHQGLPFDKKSTAYQVADRLVAFSSRGLYWNDLRSHNIMIGNGEVFAVDLEYTSAFERENTLDVFLWLLFDISTGRSNTHINDIFANGNFEIGRPSERVEDFDESLHDLVRLALGSRHIDEFAARYSAV